MFQIFDKDKLFGKKRQERQEMKKTSRMLSDRKSHRTKQRHRQKISMKPVPHISGITIK